MSNETEYKKPNYKKGLAVIGFMALIVTVAVGVSFYAGHNHALYFSDYLGFGGPDNAQIHISSNVRIYADFDSDGIIDLIIEGHNQIQNDGRSEVARYIAEEAVVNSNASTHAFHWIAIGTGTGQGVSATALATEFDRQIGTDAYPSAYNFTITYTWTAGSFSGQTIQECGLFNEAASGVMFNYHDFTGITLQSTDSLQVEIEVQVGT